ncbi:hypothetical protein [Ruminococcus sp.]|uniref:hypothetical protein n=1 Tax=Ruminococcus sp. TaxID=41978 RepID=UPI001B612081|nr:hypothetical protein [Ruminococcus sp.]MBP5433589.1 hypothetical protein [Ruminococcus sp.]
MRAKTVGNSSHDEDVIVNPLRIRQKEDVAKMRTSLLSCSEDTNITVTTALQYTTVMRVYHQLTRIVRFTEMMDKIEDKLYEAIDYELDNSDTADPATLVKLLGIQEKLQKSMIESQKLLDPYLNTDLFNITDLVPATATDRTDDPITKQLMTSESRDKVRAAAQNVLSLLGSEGDDTDD